MMTFRWRLDGPYIGDCRVCCKSLAKSHVLHIGILLCIYCGFLGRPLLFHNPGHVADFKTHVQPHPKATTNQPCLNVTLGQTTCSLQTCRNNLGNRVGHLQGTTWITDT